jgi:hypothetical protein
MALSDKAMQRLAQLGYAGEADLEFWRELWQSEGESFFWFFLSKREKAAEEYRRWFPRLQAFAVECRRAVPVPTVESFSAVEREQYRVLLGKMQEFVASEDRRCILGRKPNQAAIVSTTRVGLAAAEQVFAGSGAVLLQEEERKRWFSEVYPIDPEAFWWYAFAWWSVRERLAGEEEESICGHYPNPEGGSDWIVVSGVQWGSLAGGANHELWRWDGQRARFIVAYRVDSY